MKQLTLPGSIYSPDQVGTLIQELNDYQTHMRNAATKKKTGSKGGQPIEASSSLSELLKSTGSESLAPDDLDDIRRELNAMLSKSPVAHMTVATTPSLAIKREVVAWFRKEVSPNMLLTFSVRTDIGGGAILRCGSRIYDFSFKSLLLANKQKLAEIAGRV